MAINKKLIHFKNKENFDSEVANGNILDNSIVFIQDSKEISTHGTVYKSVNWSVLEAFIFYIDDLEFRFDPGMNFYDFINSEYNNDDNPYGYIILGEAGTNRIFANGADGWLCYEDGTIVNLQDPIQEGITYYFEKPLP
jgi:hypothetical protein